MSEGITRPRRPENDQKTASEKIPRPLDTVPGLTPTFYVLSKNKKNSFRIPKDEQVFRIGKSEDCDIVIDDQSISNIQVSVVKLGNQCYFMDCGTEDRVSFNGIKCRQLATSTSSRVIMKVGQTWIIYVGIDSNDYTDEGNTFVLKRSLVMGKKLEAQPQAEILLQSQFGESHTDSAPILVGTHKACDYKLTGEGINPFHFVIYFNPDGLFIQDLTLGSPGIKIDDLKSIGARPVKQDCVISIGKFVINMYVYGNVTDRCEYLYSDHQEQPELAMTTLNTQNTCTMPLEVSNDPYLLGRGSECDIFLDDPSISRLHAKLQVKKKCIYLADNQSSNKCFVNLREVTKAKVVAGDIVEFGNICFLVHYSF